MQALPTLAMAVAVSPTAQQWALPAFFQRPCPPVCSSGCRTKTPGPASGLSALCLPTVLAGQCSLLCFWTRDSLSTEASGNHNFPKKEC